MSAKAKTWFERFQFLLTVFLIPMVLGAWNWAGSTEDRISKCETRQELTEKDRKTSEKEGAEVTRMLREIGTTSIDSRERIVRMETQIQAILEELRKR